MKTIRTILGTLAAVVLGYGLLAVISFRANSPFLQRTLYQIFSQSYFVTLVLGVAFLLIAIILTVALMSFRDDAREERAELDDDLMNASDEEEDDDPYSDPVTFRRPARPQTAVKEESEQPSEDTDVPAFLMKGATRPRVSGKEMPNVESIFDDPVEEVDEDEAESPVQRKGVRHCIFCNAVIEDDSTICPSCHKRL